MLTGGLLPAFVGMSLRSIILPRHRKRHAKHQTLRDFESPRISEQETLGASQEQPNPGCLLSVDAVLGQALVAHILG